MYTYIIPQTFSVDGHVWSGLGKSGSVVSGSVRLVDCSWAGDRRYDNGGAAALVLEKDGERERTGRLWLWPCHKKE